MKKCKVQEESKKQDKEKKQGFGDDLKWAQYKRSSM